MSEKAATDPEKVEQLARRMADSLDNGFDRSDEDSLRPYAEALVEARDAVARIDTDPNEMLRGCDPDALRLLEVAVRAVNRQRAIARSLLAKLEALLSGGSHE